MFSDGRPDFKHLETLDLSQLLLVFVDVKNLSNMVMLDCNVQYQYLLSYLYMCYDLCYFVNWQGVDTNNVTTLLDNMWLIRTYIILNGFLDIYLSYTLSSCTYS